MNYGDIPREEERAAVRLDLLTLEMSHGKELSDNFINVAAKLKRYSYWEGDKFMIDYPLAKQYLYRIFDKLSNDQRITLYYYNVQMIQLHQDMDELAKQQASEEHAEADVTTQHDEEIFKFVHPSFDDEEAWKVHKEVKRLVKRQGIQEICLYLKKLASEDKIYLPIMPSVAYAELVRMGMPTTEGFGEKYFGKHYHQ